MYKIRIQYNKYTAHIINIYDINIFKIIASILWKPKLASTIINIFQFKITNPSNFAEAFAIQSTKRLSQHGQNKSTKMDLPRLPETPTSTANNSNMDNDDIDHKNS